MFQLRCGLVTFLQPQQGEITFDKKAGKRIASDVGETRSTAAEQIVFLTKMGERNASSIFDKIIDKCVVERYGC
jgi:ribosomal silencing factor RsfS